MNIANLFSTAQPSRPALIAAGLVLTTATLAAATVWLPPVAPVEFAPLLKLGLAVAIGFVVASLQKTARSIEHAQILLCLAGALIVMLIGDSLARAAGIAGGAALVRFRTPVDDPREAATMFLLMGLGMATGLGLYAVAGVGTLVLCALLLVLPDPAPKPEKAKKDRYFVLRISPGTDTQAVEAALDLHATAYELRETGVDGVAYAVQLSVPVAKLHQELMSVGGVTSVAWQPSKKERLS